MMIQKMTQNDSYFRGLSNHQVVKDGNQRRLVRRLEHANSEELGDFDDTASWESWRSGLDSCTGRK